MVLNIRNKAYYLYAMQFLSFILLIAFASELRPIGLLPLILIFSEIALLFFIRKSLKITVFIWQFQFFIIFFIGSISYPEQLFNSSSPPNMAVGLALVFSAVIEVLIALGIFYGERPIVFMLKGATLSMIGVVLLIILLIGSEGMYGFIENDPIEMLTSTEWYPEYNPDQVYVAVMETAWLSHSFQLVMHESTIHAVIDRDRNSTFLIKNDGALENQVSLEIVSPDNGLTIDLNRTEIDLAQGESVLIGITICPIEIGTYEVELHAKDSHGKSVVEIITVTIDRENAIDFSKELEFRSISGFQSNYLGQKVTLINHGSEESELRLTVLANGSLFRPSLTLPEWDVIALKADINLSANSELTFILVPGFMVQMDGTHEVVLKASQNGITLDTFTFTFDYKYVRAVQSQEGYSIPLHKDVAVIRDFEVIAYGTPQVMIEPFEPTPGLDMDIMVNGTVIPFESPINLFLVDGKVNVTLVFTAGQEYVGPGEIGFKITSPGTDNNYGMLAFIFGSFITTFIALLIAVPLAIGSAVFLVEYCPNILRIPLKSAMEILAGVPSVIYGLWGGLTLGPILNSFLYPAISSTLGLIFPFFSLETDGVRSTLTASIVLGIMILPIVLALSYEALAAVPSELREASYAVGSSKWQTIRKVMLKHGRSGILAAIVLGMGRAIGETMAVLMIMGSSSRLPSSIFDSVGTMTSIIASSFASSFGDDHSRHGLFSVALLLFVMVLILNLILTRIIDERPSRVSRRLKSAFRTGFNGLTGIKPLKRLFKLCGYGSTNYKSSQTLFFKDRIASGLIVTTAVIVIAFVFFIIGDIMIRGGLSLRIDYLILPETGSGNTGGFLNAIAGSVQMVLIALLFSVPLSIMAAIYVNEYAKKDGMMVRLSMLASTTLASTPSIIFGAFGFMLFIFILDFGFSMIAGGLTLACMVIPLIFVNSVEALKMVPNGYREASQALGATKWGMVRSIVLPVSVSAIVSGIIIAIGRAIGETAAVLLTAGYLIIISPSIFLPAASMPNMIYQYYDLTSKVPVYEEKLYAVAFVLIMIVITLNVVARVIARATSGAIKM